MLFIYLFFITEYIWNLIYSSHPVCDSDKIATININLVNAEELCVVFDTYPMIRQASSYFSRKIIMISTVQYNFDEW